MKNVDYDEARDNAGAQEGGLQGSNVIFLGIYDGTPLFMHLDLQLIESYKSMQKSVSSYSNLGTPANKFVFNECYKVKIPSFNE